MDEVSADEGYLSFENMELTAEVGAVPLLRLQDNSRAENGPTIWEKMYAIFTLHAKSI